MKISEFQSNEENRNEELKISIETATIADLETIQKFNQELCVKENKEFDILINPDYSFSKRGEEYFRARIESQDGLAILAKEGNVAVGYLIGGMIKSEDYRTVKPIAELENMFVDESMRSKGVGSKLVSRFEDWCRERKVQVIRVVASAANENAIRFYERNGAKPVSLTLEKMLISE
jgi:GNAT superfamily N-acetyltransferase